jgi:luciferase family oxidoreductase group 1
MGNLRLSVVDQSPAHDNKGQSHGLACTIELAKICDQLGYTRYWIAEHHATPSYSSPCPEIVIGQIAANTERIKVGSGGIMLSHYSPYKVAEVFRTLSAFFPGRIDLGFGRAPGGAALPSRALAQPHSPVGPEAYPQLVDALVGFADNNIPDGHYFEGLQVTPQDSQAPELWTLGSAAGSIEIAAQYGIGFVLALFIGNHERPAEIIQHYRSMFRPRPGSDMQNAQAMISSAVICADSKEEAELLAASHTFWKVMAGQGIREGLRPPEECMDLVKTLPLSLQEEFKITRNAMVLGTPEQCRETLEQQAAYYDVEEVVVVAVTHSFDKRRESYRKLAEVFDLNS